MTLKKFTKEQKQMCMDLVGLMLHNPNDNISDCIHNLYIDYQNGGKDVDSVQYLSTVKCFLERFKIEDYDAIMDIL